MIRLLSGPRLFLGKSRLQRLTYALKSLGPLVMVGKPGERLPHWGPRTVYLDADTWEEGVRKLIRYSRFVVIRGALTWHVAREIELAAEILQPTQILFWFPDGNDVEYLEIAKNVCAYLRCKAPAAKLTRVHFFYLTSYRNPVCVPFNTLGMLSLGTEAMFYKTLEKFLTELGVRPQLCHHYLTKAVIWRVTYICVLLAIMLLWPIIKIYLQRALMER